jgi:phenylacetate-coenzyme A ligase PaaK-like adenylate-forming protein
MSYETERAELIQQVRAVTDTTFEAVALQVFQFQARHNPLYRHFLALMGCTASAITTIDAIPFLPISAFKHHRIQTGVWEPETIFQSSGTTGSTPSQHLVRSLRWYREQARRGFTPFYSAPADFCILGLLPSYLERSGSSLVYMVDDFISQSAYQESGFFLNDYAQLVDRLQYCQANAIPTLVIGVSFAMWELAETFPGDYSSIIFMETGGMKGRRQEITRPELHAILTRAFQVPAIHSEYGMTELLSQAYSKGKGLFTPSSTLKVIPREITDPMTTRPFGKTGVLHLVDLANLDTISFIATEDLGRCYADGQFEVLGRLDASDIRGCNLMVQDV